MSDITAQQLNSIIQQRGVNNAFQYLAAQGVTSVDGQPLSNPAVPGVDYGTAQPTVAPVALNQSPLQAAVNPQLPVQQVAPRQNALSAISALAQQSADIGQQRERAAQSQYDAAAAALKQNRGLSATDWLGLSAAMAAPTRAPGFAGFLGNMVPALAGIAQQHEAAKQQAQALAAKYQQDVIAARQQAIKDQLEAQRVVAEYGAPEKEAADKFMAVPAGGRLVNTSAIERAGPLTTSAVKAGVTAEMWGAMTPAERNAFQ